MNEPIHAIIQQINKQVGVFWTNEDKLKFAELIVQKVLDKIDNEGFEVYPPVLQQVRDYFGLVE